VELRYLRYFVAVAELKNFTRAAERLHVAQPAVSQQIKALEQELEVTLLHRDRRHVALTAAGTAFLAEAQAIIARADQSVQVARRAARGEVGRLAIGCFSSAVSGFLPQIVAAYRTRFPAVRVHMMEMTPDQQIQGFEQGRIDLGFTRPLGRNHAGRFISERLYTDRLMAALPEAHRLARGTSVELRRLADDDFVLFQRAEAPELVDQMTQLCSRAGFSPRVVSEPPMMQTVLMAVAAGVGVSLVPGCTRTFLQPGVSLLRVRPVSPVIPLMMVRPKGDMPPTVAAFTALLRERLPEIRRVMEGGLDPTDTEAGA
jgi:DNA-binding transcriptional LysR family regulator